MFTFRPLNNVDIKPHKGTITKLKKGQYAYDSEFIHIDNLELSIDNIEEKACSLYTSMLLRHNADIKFIVKTAKKVNNIPDLLIYMRSLYMASKSKGDVETMRIDGGKFVKKYVKASNESIVSPVRTGIMLYILLRMFAKDHYG